MDIPKLKHIGIDKWKLERVMNLYEGGHTLQDIADQVDVEGHIVEKVIELAKKQKSESIQPAA
ncbi:hypothetical protein [Nitrososphaera sp.]|uniref:hypothetical protein n=1 Tax=Nitrososphaera sp. TaxID=1971748 RepID=UPI002EDB8649